MHIHSSTIRNSCKVETQVFIRRLLDKPNVVHLYNGLLFGRKKEWSAGIYHSVDEPWKQDAGGWQPVKESSISYSSICGQFPGQAIS